MGQGGEPLDWCAFTRVAGPIEQLIPPVTRETLREHAPLAASGSWSHPASTVGLLRVRHVAAA